MEKESNKEIYEIIISSIIGFVVGDAIGVPVEFNKREDLTANPVVDMKEFGTHNQPKGTWSDDTSMMIATMDSISECQEINYEDIMTRYYRWYKESEYTATNITFDVGLTIRRALEKFGKGTKCINCGMRDYNSNGNGSLMRMLPISLYMINQNYDTKTEIETTYYYSSLTHAHDISIMGCKLYTDIIKELLKTGNLREALGALKNYDYKSYYDNYLMYNNIITGRIMEMTEEQIKSTGFVVSTLEASIWSILNSNSFEEAVLKAVNLGGDTDTIGAITGSIAGIIYGYNSIPKKWIDSIQNKELVSKITEKFIITLKKKENLVSEEKHYMSI